MYWTAFLHTLSCLSALLVAAGLKCLSDAYCWYPDASPWRWLACVLGMDQLNRMQSFRFLICTQPMSYPCSNC